MKFIACTLNVVLLPPTESRRLKQPEHKNSSPKVLLFPPPRSVCVLCGGRAEIEYHHKPVCRKCAAQTARLFMQ